MAQKAVKLRVWREKATQVVMTQPLYCHVVASNSQCMHTKTEITKALLS